jgi:hypothetical protein
MPMALERCISAGSLSPWPGEDVGDAVDGGFEPDGISGGGPGDDYLQAVFAVAAEAYEPFLGG